MARHAREKLGDYGWVEVLKKNVLLWVLCCDNSLFLQQIRALKIFAYNKMIFKSLIKDTLTEK